MNPLREPLNDAQTALLRVVYQPFETNGLWPYWQYADIKLDEMGYDAAAALASLPVAGSRGAGSRSYELTWRQDSHREPGHDTPVCLTVAGLRRLPEASDLVDAYFAVLRLLIEQQRKLIPEPRKIVEATVPSAVIGEHVFPAAGVPGSQRALLLEKVREVLAHEPPLYGAVQRHPSSWSVKVPARLRGYRDVSTIDEYLDRVAETMTSDHALPATPPQIPDLPGAIGYLDAVWMSCTRCHLFAYPDPASVARLTYPCAGEDDFASLMSALADILGQIVAPGSSKPSKRGALQSLRAYLQAHLEGDSVIRACDAVDSLLHLAWIRNGAQHGDARHKAVTAFSRIGLAFPPPSWPAAWSHVSWAAKNALDALREEAHAGLFEP